MGARLALGSGLSRIAGAALAGLGLVSGLAAVLAQGGRMSWALDVLTHAAPLYGLAGLAGVLGGLWPGRLRKAGLVGGLVALAGAAALMLPEYRRPVPPPLVPSTPAESAGRLKIIQFNAFKKNADIRAVADWLIAEDPDIVTIQETRHDLRDLLLARTTWHVAGRKEHVMIFSREPRLGMTRPKPVVRDLTFINATYPGPGGPYEVVTVHFDWPNASTYRNQYAALAEVVAARPRERMILAGDFNTTPWSFAMRRTDHALGLRRLDRAAWSFPARLGALPWPVQVLPIDHVYAGPGWRLVGLRRGPSLGSDHRPLIVELAPAMPEVSARAEAQ
ncbi:endonuclease/exonuclease/phosphatase family protein [Phenylobacterium sp. SCN 70-31]|uniref:endonuclease/exonuclease/phosphatase family protein n=1 Tax=Phenylobacterium sp. SCN 70-31 TaxID=1660129 RepID=UPI00086A4C27|nr:endonuclease/exonuclease/phosphatase family protein [Phenylobacterium sp. SCN 70-31]ODT87445.1 MAG: hypothetical protein ABS78_11225 [Phenylobacterium sp. SCN 70-31]